VCNTKCFDPNAQLRNVGASSGIERPWVPCGGVSAASLYSTAVAGPLLLRTDGASGEELTSSRSKASTNDVNNNDGDDAGAVETVTLPFVTVIVHAAAAPDAATPFAHGHPSARRLPQSRS